MYSIKIKLNYFILQTFRLIYLLQAKQDILWFLQPTFYNELKNGQLRPVIFKIADYNVVKAFDQTRTFCVLSRLTRCIHISIYLERLWLFLLLSHGMCKNILDEMFAI
jgi:hypothetical protein